jgi:phosphoribosylformylglycinamidine synthase
VLRVKGTRKALAVSTDGNGRQVLLDPRQGAAMAVAEAARNVACSGGRPIGVTDCLNFGSPERPEILWQLAEAIDGIAEACRALELPVVGGNVSLYNETLGRAILPTPVIGVVGLLEDGSRVGTQWFKAEGDRIALLGPDDVSLGGSEYLMARHGKTAGRLARLDLETERRVQAATQAAVAAGLTTASHDCAEGGLAVALGEGCVTGPERVGAEVTVPGAQRPDVSLFGEGPSRVVVTVPPPHVAEFEALMAESAIPWRWVGRTGGARLVIRGAGGETLVDVECARLEHAWRTGFERHMA